MCSLKSFKLELNHVQCKALSSLVACLQKTWMLFCTFAGLWSFAPSANENNIVAQRCPTLLGECWAMLAKGAQTITACGAMLHGTYTARGYGINIYSEALPKPWLPSIQWACTSSTMLCKQTTTFQQSQEQKKWWLMWGQKFEWFQTSCNMCQHHATLPSIMYMYKQSQHVAPNNIGSVVLTTVFVCIGLH